MYGAFYCEGSVNVLLELMDLGSLRNILNIAKKHKLNGIQVLFVESIASYIIKEVIKSF